MRPVIPNPVARFWRTAVRDLLLKFVRAECPIINKRVIPKRATLGEGAPESFSESSDLSSCAAPATYLFTCHPEPGRLTLANGGEGSAFSFVGSSSGHGFSRAGQAMMFRGFNP